LLALTGIFEARADLLIAQIQTAIQAREAERVKDAAHELKGMLLNLAATDAYLAVRELEAAGRSASYDAASACLSRLVQETPRLLSALRARASACA
jgi:HPt (histidine-containing phosphotransfer) domain-containing protein